MPLKIFIVEDHPIMRETLAAFVGDQPGYEVLAAAPTAEEALERLEEVEVDLVLVDVSLPGMSGIDLVGEIGARWPALMCLMISGHGEAAYVERALAAGARGYVLKGNPYELPGAIRDVTRGETYLSASLKAA